MEKKCEICKKTYWIRKSHAHLRRTCSRKCAAILKSVEKSGENSPSWAGGAEYSMGYRYVYAPNHPDAYRNKVAEHKLVAEKKLGRYMKPNEVVHHINGNKLDNRPENIIVVDRGWHLNHHDPHGWGKHENI
jgi:hypothetical protein